MNAMISVMTFALRHLCIVLLAIAAGCLVWTLLYAILLVAAILFHQGVGGPLAYPVGLFFIVSTTIVIGWGIFAPAAAIGAIACSALKLPRLVAIPVVAVVAFILNYGLYWAYIEWISTTSMPSVFEVLKNFMLFLSIPLGIYWWITEGPGAIFDVLHSWIVRRRKKNS